MVIIVKIFRDRIDNYYTFDNKALGNCITIIDDNYTYHYEFEVNHNEAKIIYDGILHINDAIDFFRKYNKNVVRLYNEDRSFFKAFDDIFTFKLPLDILQPSKFFIDQDKYNAIEKYLENETFTLPVCIIDDEYVLLDGHARVKYLLDNYVKMVDVYLDEAPPEVSNFVYIAKENNIFKVKNMEILPHEDYLEYLNQTGNIDD